MGSLLGLPSAILSFLLHCLGGRPLVSFLHFYVFLCFLSHPLPPPQLCLAPFPAQLSSSPFFVLSPSGSISASVSLGSI